MSVSFSRKFPWAMLPRKTSVDTDFAAQSATDYSDSFRWARRNRVAESCWPWRVAQQLGWVLSSPIDICMTPIDDFELHCPEEDVSRVMKLSGASEIWKRDDTCIAVRGCPWLRMFDFKVNDCWDSMFVPNGQGTVEWRQGLQVDVPTGVCLLILPASQNADLSVPAGLLTKKLLDGFNEGVGLSIAVHPNAKCHIKRGDPIAWLVPINEEVLQLKLYWFSVNWNFVWFELVRVGRLPVEGIAASCREGLSL